jgi:DNA-binding response OmpR family regulator
MSLDDGSRTLQVGPIEARLDDGLARVDGRAVFLTEHEFKLLVALMRHCGQVVRRGDLYFEVWGDALRRGDRSVDVYVFKLRGKLEVALPGWTFIHTHTGWGYRLDPEWQGAPRQPSAGSERASGIARRSGSPSSRRDGRPTNYAQGSYT